MKKTISLMLSVLLLVAVLGGCGSAKDSASSPQAEAGTPAKDNSSAYPIRQLIIGTTSVVETATRNEYNYDMLASGTSELPLVYQDISGNYHPLVADYATEDATTWTYTVRPGLLWDDGEPVTAEDILFTLQYDEANGTAVFKDQTDSEGKITKAKYSGYALTDDGMSISLTLASANVRELSNMTSFRVMPKHIYEGRDSVSDAEARIGCGPYVFENFSKEAGTVTFAANPGYPKQPNVEKLIFQFYGSEDTMYMALRSGDIDMTWNYSSGVPASYAEVLGDSVSLTNVPAVNEPAVLAFNNSKGLFADENLRKAVSYALNYEQFREYFGSEGSMLPKRGFVPATTLGYIETESMTTDIAKAEALMAEAGYTEKNANGFFVNGDGKVASFALTYNADKVAHAGFAEVIKTQLEAFGISVELDGVDKDSYNAKTSNKFSENNITMEAAIVVYTAAGMGMGNGLGSIYVDGSHAVQGGCQVYDEEFAAALDEMASSANLEAYCAGAAKLQQYYAEHTPLIALYWDNLVYACNAAYENLTVDCVFGLNNVNNWFSISVK